MKGIMASGIPVISLLLVLLACGPGPNLENARRQAEVYFQTQVNDVDPSWANLFGYMHKRFGLELHNA